MAHSKVLPLLFLSCILFSQNTHQLQNSQTQVLYQLRKHLEFPKALESWGSYYGDLCQIPSTPHMSISCEQGNSVITELKIMGDKLSKPAGMFHGSSLQNHTLSKAFLIDSFVTTLTRLTSLKVLTLVSLGIFGELPGKIHRLYSLESLDLSSNYLFGSLPPDVSRLVKLQSLTLDGNYFNGSVPDALDSLSDLTVLSLKNNRFSGLFPSSVCRIGKLTNLALSHNEISGELPDLSGLDHLHMLDLRENRFDSDLPLLPKSLVTVLLSKNSFSGEVSGRFDGLSQLQHLDLSFNHLTGAPSSLLFSLPNISYLDLASNKLSGKLPSNLTCGGKLGFVDLSDNRLVGTPPSCLAGSSGERVVKLGGNCLSINGVHGQREELLCEEAETKGRELQGRKIGMLVAVISGAVLVLVLCGFGLLMLCTKRSCCCSKEKSVTQSRLKGVTDHSHNNTSLSSQVLATARLVSQTAKLSAQGVPSCRSFSFEELKEATDDFDSSRFLGEGSLGKLYRGTLENGSSVAIRCIVLSRKFSNQSIRGHLDCLSKLNHPHLLTFLGHCTQTSGVEYEPSATILYLVYEYMPKGTYRAHLSESCPEKILTWPDRLAILIEIAKAVHFLHTGVIPGSFNNQLKTNNILLDEHKIAKLSDYGLSAIIEENEKLLETKSEGHNKSKYNVAKREDDVYNFGFILLESLVGPLPTSKGEAFLLNEMTSFGSQDGRQKIVNPTVLTTSSQESLAIAISIANKCVLLEPSARPSFEDVLWNLQYAAQMQSAADAERKSDTSS
ncbi:Leucine-rich repeat protein kinase family protein [Hirschfeldia incana]|nr:Leucine-rich repeat protein kinase family protein [Hirschfeldia incana]